MAKQQSPTKGVAATKSMVRNAGGAGARNGIKSLKSPLPVQGPLVRKGK